MAKHIQLNLLCLIILLLGGGIANGQKLTYKGSFTNGTSSTTAQCQAWNAYRATLLNSYDYTKVTFSSSITTTKYEVTDATEVKKIADALRTGTTYANTTNNWNVSLACGGGCGGVVVELHINQNACQCTQSASLRPAILNLNWGGIGLTCSAPSQDLILEFEYATAPVDAGVIEIAPLTVCDLTQDIKATFRNNGQLVLDSVDINWELNGVAQPTIKYNRPYDVSDTLTPFASKELTLKSSHNFTANTDYEIKVWTSNPNGMQDTVADKDTMWLNVRMLGSPNDPTASSFRNCGSGEVPVSVTPDNSGDSIVWFTEKSGLFYHAMGKDVLSPYLDVTDTLYAKSYRLDTSEFAESLVRTNWWGTGYPDNVGGMITVKSNGEDVILSELSFGCINGGNTNYELYYKVGSHVSFETDASSWTLLTSGNANTRTYGVNELIDIPVKVLLPANSSVAFYFNPVDNPITFSTQPGQANAAFSTSGGSTLRGVHNLFNATYTVDHAVRYYYPACANSNAKVEVPIEIVPLAIGADLEEGSTFEGTFAGGTMTDPDIVAEGDEIVYNLSNPTNYPNTSYGTTWEVTSTSLETVNGTVENMGTIVFTPTSGSADGTYSYTAHDDFTDSTLKVSITIQDLNTLCDTVIERYIFVAPRVDPGFGLPAALCQGDAISFINRSTISSGGIIYKWEFGDGDTSIAPNTSHIYAQPGTYTVKLTTTSTPYGYVTDTTAIITVEETPQANFNRTNACEGINVELTNTTSYGGTGTVAYDWDFGDGSAHSSNTNESKLYNTPNSYVVTLVADVAGCKTSKSKTVYQFATPDVDFTAPSSSVCNHTEVNLSNQSSLLNGTMGAYWDFGNGVNSNLLNGKVTYGSASTFDVKLKMISEFGCTDSLTKQVVVSEGASADFEYDLACIENATNFTFSGDAPSGQSPLIVWTFDSEGQDGGASVSHNWQSLGSKNVQVKVVLNNGCNDSITKTIVVQDQPKVDFTYVGMCEDDAVIFQNNSSVGSGDLAYEWSFGDNTTSTKVSPTHQYTAGSYSVKLKASLAGACPDSLTKVVDISANPVCDFTIADEYVWGHRGFKFNPTDNSYPFYRWTFGEGGKSSDASPVYQYNNDGKFSVTLFARNAAGCECEKTVQHDVNDVVGIDETSLNGVSVYPNPTTGQLTIDLPKAGEDYTIEVMNVIGKVVQTGEYTNAAESIELNIGHQARGIYLIKITSNNKSKTVKVNLLD